MVKKYSDFIRWPITMDFAETEAYDTGEKDENGNPILANRPIFTEDTINSMIPIWQRDKDEVSEEEINDFYKNAFYDYEPPVGTVRVSVEGQVTYRAMLFIPGRLPTKLCPQRRGAGTSALLQRRYDYGC